MLFLVAILFTFKINYITAILEGTSEVPEKCVAKETISFFTPQNLIENYLKNVKYDTNENVTHSEISQTCARDLIIFQKALYRREKWSQQMADASTKVPPGLLTGNIIDLGMFDECLQVQDKSSNIEIHGRHCMYTIDMPQYNIQNLIFPSLSICLPASCDVEDVFSLVNEVIHSMDTLENSRIKISSVKCSSNETEIWNTEFQTVVYIFIIFISFLIFCTFCESIIKQNTAENKYVILESLAEFSLRKNLKAILNVEVKQNSLSSIHGIRSLTLVLVIFGHEFLAQSFGANINYKDTLIWLESWSALPFLLIHFGVDIFFILSGFLMTYGFLKFMLEHKKFNIFLYYFNRYLRLTPPILALIMLTMFITPKTGSGARWNMLMDIFCQSGCRTKWWSLILYIQNFVEKENMCLGHLWYLAVDMQLYWISPLILYPLHKKPKLGLTILSILIIASIIVPMVIIAVRNGPVYSFIRNMDIAEALDLITNIYIMPHHRAGPWLLGIYLGYEIINHDRKLGMLGKTCGWLLASLCFLFCVLGTRFIMNSNYEFNVVSETLFAVLCKPLWAAGICWIIYVSISYPKCILSKFFSWKYFQPLSKISYSIFLLHLGIQMIQVAQQRTPQYISIFYLVRSYIFTMTIVTVFALFFCLVFESPFIVLKKKIIKIPRVELKNEVQENILTKDQD